MRDVLNNSLRFILLTLLQALLFNNMGILQLSIPPHVYILIILLLPFEISGSIVLLISFAAGFAIDVFTDTLGLHAASAVFAGFVRPFILRYLAPYDGYEIGMQPRVAYYGLSWFIRYAGVLVLAHHITFYFLDAFTFEHFEISLLKILISGIYTLILVVLSQYLIFRK